jgi:hypothetical protein
MTLFLFLNTEWSYFILKTKTLHSRALPTKHDLIDSSQSREGLAQQVVFPPLAATGRLAGSTNLFVGAQRK